MKTPFLLPLKVNGSETTRAIWIEDANGKRIATIKNCATDSDIASAIVEAVNEHQFDTYKRPQWMGNPAID